MDDDRGGPYWMYGMHRAHDTWWHSPVQIVLWLLVVALLVVGIVWLVRRLSPPSASVPGAAAPGGVATAVTPAAADPAVAELRLRYARGEIDREAYLQSFADLTGRAELWPGQPTADAPTASPPAAG